MSNLVGNFYLYRKLDLIIGMLAKLDQITARMDVLAAHQKRLDERLANMVTTLDDVVAAVAAEKTQVDSLAAFVGGLEQQLADALSGTAISPATQAKIDAVFAGVGANTAEIVAAMNTTVSPPPPPPAPTP